MGKIIEERIDRFDGGMSNDIRADDASMARLIKGFDPLTFARRLVPYRDSESGNDTTSRSIANFLYANSKLWGYGIDTGTTTRIYYKTDLTDGTWLETANNLTAIINRQTNLFVYYKGSIYGIHGSQSVWQYDTTGGGFTDVSHSLSAAFTSVQQGIVHSKDDMLYIPYNNLIARNNAGSWTDPALTLPSDCLITAICEYGNYLAIATAPIGTAGRPTSKVYLWDRDSSLSTISETIDWGEGVLCLIEELEGHLVGISAIQDNALASRLAIKVYAGASGAIKVAELSDPSGAAIVVTRARQKTKNRLYFPVAITIDGTAQYGVFSVGRNSQSRPFALTMEYLVNNDTDPTSIQSAFQVGDYMFVAYTTTGTTYVSKTNNTSSYTATAIYESLKKNLGDASVSKKLLGITLLSAALPAAGQGVVKYKADGDSSWTTILTNTTDSSISKSAVTIETTGANLPEYKEIQFRIESTGGAEITGLKFKSEVLDKDFY